MYDKALMYFYTDASFLKLFYFTKTAITWLEIGHFHPDFLPLLEYCGTFISFGILWTQYNGRSQQPLPEFHTALSFTRLS